MIADDLFAGAGGWELGAQALGIHGRGVENMKEARLTRDAAGLETIHDDVWTFVPDGKAEGQIASPPCQTFSAAGKGAGRKALDDVLSIIRRNEFIDMDTLRARAAELGDDRTGLVLTPLHFLVNYPNYRWAAWEQVPTVQPAWDACADKLRSWGWNVWTGRMQAEQYGVPQTRKRSILIASRDYEVGMPTPTHSKFYSRTPEKRDKGVLPWVSMAEALGWAEGGGNHPDAGDVVMVSNYGTGGDPRNRGRRTFDEPAPTVTPKIDRNRIEVYPTHMGDIRASRGTVRSVDEPSPTLTGSMDNGNFRWTHMAGAGATAQFTVGQQPRKVDEPAQTITGKGTAYWLDEEAVHIERGQGKAERPDRMTTPGGEPRFTTVSRQSQPRSVRVTVQEAGVLQSFPGDHPWRGSKGKQFLQAGNAIPPRLAMHILAEAAGVNMREIKEERNAA